MNGKEIETAQGRVEHYLYKLGAKEVTLEWLREEKRFLATVRHLMLGIPTITTLRIKP